MVHDPTHAPGNNSEDIRIVYGSSKAILGNNMTEKVGRFDKP